MSEPRRTISRPSMIEWFVAVLIGGCCGRIVGGDTTPICVERVLCPVATCKFWVYERQCCLGCREALS